MYFLNINKKLPQPVAESIKGDFSDEKTTAFSCH